MSNFNSICSKLPLLFYYYLLEVEVFKTPPNFSTASTAALEAPVTKIFNFDVAITHFNTHIIVFFYFGEFTATPITIESIDI